jgi:hypothetical protein
MTVESEDMRKFKIPALSILARPVEPIDLSVGPHTAVIMKLEPTLEPSNCVLPKTSEQPIHTPN